MPDVPFSEQYGYKPTRTAIQRESIDEALKNALWNVLLEYPLHHLRRQFTDQERRFLTDLWRDFFKRPIDTVPTTASEALSTLRTYFFDAEWFAVYDFVEYLMTKIFSLDKSHFIAALNNVLGQEKAGYRIIDGRILPITSEVELKAVESAVENSPKIVRVHLETALRMLADRKEPDFRNSIKESISAVESMCKLIAQDDKADLAKALKQLESKIQIHGALKSAFEKLYAYTGAAQGIRHSLMNEPTLDLEDALFMLVCCSGFTHYLKAKAAKAQIEIV